MTEHIVYILSTASNAPSDGPIFIGETHDLLFRMAQHRSGRPSNPAFCIDRLVYAERHHCRFKAQKRAAALKTASREWMNALITGQNPSWNDLLPLPQDNEIAA